MTEQPPIIGANEVVSPADLLDELVGFIRRFVAAPPDALTAITLWVAHAHALDAFDSTPRLALLSPEPGSGKTRVLEVLELLTPAPMHALNASAPAVFRTIENARPTLLLDEVDALFGKRGKDDSAEDLRALLNAGHRKGATIPRCVGPQHNVSLFPVFCAVALAGLGDLPDTVMSRSIVVRMRRRAPGERVEPFRHRVNAPEGHTLRDRLAAWAATVVEELDGAWPDMPHGITDRPADVWEALLSVADAAGGHWPETARTACVELCKVVANREASLGVRLLTDLRIVFGDEDRLSTETVLERLHRLEEAPWGDLRGRPLDARGLARRLTAYEVASTKVRIGDATLRGYRREDLWDVWNRYVPSSVPTSPERAEQAEHSRSQAPSSVPLTVAVPEHGRHVPEHGRYAEHDSPPLSSHVPGVPHVPDLRGRSDGDDRGDQDPRPGTGLVDLPVGHLEPCRECGAVATMRDELGPICRDHRGAA